MFLTLFHVLFHIFMISKESLTITYQTLHQNSVQCRIRPTMSNLTAGTPAICLPSVCHQTPNILCQSDNIHENIKCHEKQKQTTVFNDAREINDISCKQEPIMIKLISHQTSHVQIQLGQYRHTSEMNYIYISLQFVFFMETQATHLCVCAP